MQDGQTEGLPKGYLITFIVLLSIGIVLTIITAAVSPWISSDDPYYGFEGSIQTLTKSSGPFFQNTEGQTYTDLRETACSLASDSIDYDYDALCWLFNALESSFIGTLVGLVFGIAFSAGCILTLVMTRRKPSLVRCAGLFPMFSIITYIGTTVSYLSSNYIVFSGDCDNLLNHKLPDTLCAEAGASLLLFDMIYHIILMISIMVFGCIARRKLAMDELPTTQMQAVGQPAGGVIVLQGNHNDQPVGPPVPPYQQPPGYHHHYPPAPDQYPSMQWYPPPSEYQANAPPLPAQPYPGTEGYSHAPPEYAVAYQSHDEPEIVFDDRSPPQLSESSNSSPSSRSASRHSSSSS